MLLFGHLCHKMELCTHSGESLETLLLVYVLDFSLVTLNALSAHVCEMSNSVACVALHSQGSKLLSGIVCSSPTISTYLLCCACNLAWIRASCPSRVSHPCGGHLCPCSLPYLNSGEISAGLGFCALGYCHCSLKKTLDVVFVLVCMLHLLFGRFWCSPLDLDWSLLICIVGRLWHYWLQQWLNSWLISLCLHCSLRYRGLTVF